MRKPPYTGDDPQPPANTREQNRLTQSPTPYSIKPRDTKRDEPAFRAHNPEVAGSSPVPAIRTPQCLLVLWGLFCGDRRTRNTRRETRSAGTACANTWSAEAQDESRASQAARRESAGLRRGGRVLSLLFGKPLQYSVPYFYRMGRCSNAVSTMRKSMRKRCESFAAVWAGGGTAGSISGRHENRSPHGEPRPESSRIGAPSSPHPPKQFFRCTPLLRTLNLAPRHGTIASGKRCQVERAQGLRFYGQVLEAAAESSRWKLGFEY